MMDRPSDIARVRGVHSSAEGSKLEGRGERMESGNLSTALSEEPNMEKVRKRDQGFFLKVHLSLLRTPGPIKLPAPSPKLSSWVLYLDLQP